MISMDLLQQVKFDGVSGLIPVIIQDCDSKQVLMLGYMNEESLLMTLETGYVTFFSRSRMEIWVKGSTSGNFLLLDDIFSDCDQDSLLISAKPLGPTCHKGTISCFDNIPTERFLYQLERIVKDRAENPDDTSYTSSLLNRGIQKVAQKVGEEAVELILESQNGTDERFLEEAADLIYHLTVLIKARDLSYAAVEAILEQRHKI